MGTHVAFSRSGGIAGGSLHWAAHVDDLGQEESRRLDALIDDARFFELTNGGYASAKSPDAFAYTIEIERSGRKHRVVASDPLPEALQPLVAALTVQAKQARRRGAK